MIIRAIHTVLTSQIIGCKLATGYRIATVNRTTNEIIAFRMNRYVLAIVLGIA
jgi:hypothetical protein